MIRAQTLGVIHFAIAFTVTWLLSGSVVIAGLVALIQPVSNAAAFYLDGKLWGGLTGHDCRRCPGPRACMRLREQT
ncbi:hypothetical protein GCM10027040_23580 [Halomonas shantousis]